MLKLVVVFVHILYFLTNVNGLIIDSTLLWGPYRPSLYLGLRPAIDATVYTGLAWFGLDNLDQSEFLFRHEFSPSDTVQSNGWSQYNPRNGGSQEIIDQVNGIKITTRFVKANDGMSWVLRVAGDMLSEAQPVRNNSVFFYVVKEDLSAPLYFDGDLSQNGASEISFNGDLNQLGPFKAEIKRRSGLPLPVNPKMMKVKDCSKVQFAQVDVDPRVSWKTKEIVWKAMAQEARELSNRYKLTPADASLDQILGLNNKIAPDGNVLLVQLSYSGAFEFDVIWKSLTDYAIPINEAEIDDMFLRLDNNFDIVYRSKFQHSGKYDTQSFYDFGKSLISGLSGGIAYCTGTRLEEYDEQSTDKSEMKITEQGPFSLLATTPNRSYFPRGFLWDEGFHLSLLQHYDLGLTMNILQSWLDLMNSNGWIAREQILGDEPRSRVPREFILQNPQIANPPTLIFALENLVKAYTEVKDKYLAGDKDNFDNISGNDFEKKQLEEVKSKLENYISEAFEKFKLHYDWFYQTQSAEVSDYELEIPHKKYTFQWQGRTESLCLASGLDDYPRAEEISEAEVHADLMAWMAYFARALKDIAADLGYAKESSDFGKDFDKIMENLDTINWNSTEGAYCDLTIDNEYNEIHVCHHGYLSIMPLSLGLLKPDSQKVETLLNHIRNSEMLWSDFGLRSLSKSDKAYHTGKNYWKGPIWINMNYLLLSGLSKYYISQQGPYKELAQEIYTALRDNVINTVYQEWLSSGKIYEQYNDDTGKGQRNENFTGWTALILKILTENY